MSEPVWICTFCGKPNTEVQQVIAADHGMACICDECVQRCINIIFDARRPNRDAARATEERK